MQMIHSGTEEDECADGVGEEGVFTDEAPVESSV